MVELITPAGAQRVRELLADWPDDESRADERKIDTYWSYFERKRKSFNGTFAFGIRPAQDTGGPTPYVALTFDESGATTSVRIVTEEEAVREAKLAIEVKSEDWLRIVAGYDIGKAMTYHMLPLRVGSATTMLRNVYFVHELIVVFTRVAGAPVGAVA